MRDPLSDFDHQFPPEKSTPVEPALPDELSLADDGIDEVELEAGSEPLRTVDAETSPATEAVGAESASSYIETADVAVVFVHGMGSSKPGGTLEQFLNPSLEWIKRATTHDHHLYVNNNVDANLVEGVNILERNRATTAAQLGPGTVPVEPLPDGIDIATIRRAILRSAKTTPMIFVPPYVEAELHKEVGGEMGPTKRLVAVETWWDGEFEAPAFKDVAYWALGVAPCFILRHLALLWEKEEGGDCDSISAGMPGRPATDPHFLQSRWRVIRRVTRAIPLTVLYGFIAMLLQWVICLLLVFGSVPFLRGYVRNIIFKMTSSFGDVLVYVHDGVRSAAIRSTVERSFQWLFNNYHVQKLIVVGYSLGTVISYDLLNNRNVATAIGEGQITYVTLGSPLKKANILLQMKRDEQRISLGIPFAFASLISAGLALWQFITKESFLHATVTSWLACVSIATATLALGMGAHARPVRSLRNQALSLAQVFGTLAALFGIGVVTWSLTDDAWWVLPVGAAAVVLLLVSMRNIGISRAYNGHSINRISPFLSPGFILLPIVMIAGWYDMLDPALTYLLMALIFSVMTGSNPLEEFEAPPADGSRKPFFRRSPRFAFATPVKKWIDFWARNDLVAEFGLGDVWYNHSSSESTAFDRQPNSRRLTNFNRYTHDHTTYQSNMEQFIAPLTRLFLEDLELREVVDTTSESHGTWNDMIGATPVVGTYDRDVTRAMRTRSRRIRWFNSASMLLMATMLLFAPSIYRSIGEAIIFDVDFSEKTSSYVLTTSGNQIGNIVGQVTTTEEAADTALPPEWFTHVHRRDPLECTECVRHLPVVPEDLTEAVIANGFVRNAIVFGLGYGIVFAAFSFLRNTFLLAPWKVWESALLDTILQRQTGFSRNRLLRASVFALFAIAVLAFTVGIHVGWFGTDWLWENQLTPLQTIATFINWLLPPGVDFDIS